MLVHNLTEASVGDFTGPSVGLRPGLGDRGTGANGFDEQDEQRAARISKSATSHGGVAGRPLAAVAMIAASRAGARAAFGRESPAFFYAPAACGDAQRRSMRHGSAHRATSWEPRSAKFRGQSHRSDLRAIGGFSSRADQRHVSRRRRDFARVDGKFTGTTDQILRWGACKWGIDEDVVRAEAVAESHWRQDDAGDSSNDRSRARRDWDFRAPGTAPVVN